MRPDITATEQALYFDAPPAITIIREEKRRARFTHKCYCCHQPIFRGELHDYYFIKDYDAIPPHAFAARMHHICPVHDDLVDLLGNLR